MVILKPYLKAYYHNGYYNQDVMPHCRRSHVEKKRENFEKQALLKQLTEE